MTTRTDFAVVVTGGTANVGTFVVQSLLERGARVVVPSRSEEKLVDLREYLRQRVDERDLARLYTLVGNFSAEAEATQLQQQIVNEVGTPRAVLSSLGDFITTPSLLDATKDELQRVFDGYLSAHFMAARTFIPLLKENGGAYVFMQGPLAFELHPELGTDLISVVTAGQHMLFRALAQELVGTRVRVTELVSHAFIRDRQTQEGSLLSGENVGAYAAYLLTSTDIALHGQTIHFRSPEQLADAGLAVEQREAQ